MRCKFATPVQERWLVRPTLMTDTVKGQMRTLVTTKGPCLQVLTNEVDDGTRCSISMLYKRSTALNAQGYVDYPISSFGPVTTGWPNLHLVTGQADFEL